MSASVAMMSSPEASGSNVPACPALRVKSILLSFLITQKLVGPIGLSTSMSMYVTK